MERTWRAIRNMRSFSKVFVLAVSMACEVACMHPLAALSNEQKARALESMEVELTFAPQVRVPAFSEELQLRVAGTTRKLLSVSGMAQGMEW